MTEFKVCFIDWEGPAIFPGDRPIRKPEDLINAPDNIHSPGIYQVYSNSNYLTYIGMTYKRTMWERLKTQYDWRFKRESDPYFKFYCGTVSSDDIQIDKPTMELIEELFIMVHKPIGNGHKTQGLSLYTRNLLVINYGMRGALFPVYTGLQLFSTPGSYDEVWSWNHNLCHRSLRRLLSKYHPNG